MSVAISPQTAIGPASYDALEKEYNKRESEMAQSSGSGSPSSSYLNGMHPSQVPFHDVDTKTKKSMIHGLMVLQRVKADNNVHKVANRLFIGSIGGALNVEELQKNGITHILCVATGIKPMHLDKFTYFSVQMLDAESESLLDILPECLAWIASSLNESQKHSVFVHCFAGRSRSVAVVLAYLVYARHMPLRLAFTHIRRVRPESSPNSGFMRQLSAFEQSMLKSTTAQEEASSAEDSGKSKEEIERDVAVLIPEAKEILRSMDEDAATSNKQQAPTEEEIEELWVRVRKAADAVETRRRACTTCDDIRCGEVCKSTDRDKGERHSDARCRSSSSPGAFGFLRCRGKGVPIRRCRPDSAVEDGIEGRAQHHHHHRRRRARDLIKIVLLALAAVLTVLIVQRKLEIFMIPSAGG